MVAADAAELDGCHLPRAARPQLWARLRPPAREVHRHPAGLQEHQERRGGEPEGVRHQGLCQDGEGQHGGRRRRPTCAPPMRPPWLHPAIDVSVCVWPTILVTT